MSPKEQKHIFVVCQSGLRDVSNFPFCLFCRLFRPFSHCSPAVFLVCHSTHKRAIGDRCNTNQRRSTSSGLTTGALSPNNRTDANSDTTVVGKRRVTGTWTCEACNAVNAPDNDDYRNNLDLTCCSVCMNPRRNTRSSDQESERGGGGYCESRGKRAVTLAQIRGLEEMPEPALTMGEWKYVGN